MCRDPSLPAPESEQTLPSKARGGVCCVARTALPLPQTGTEYMIQREEDSGVSTENSTVAYPG